jgi:ElaB/YqjD/DUF883 family membrane-anchored ribosome-binding protein
MILAVAGTATMHPGATEVNENATSAQLKSDLTAVMRDAEALIKASADQGGEKMSEARAKVNESLEKARARLREAERIARQHGEDALNATEDYARSTPWQAMGLPRQSVGSSALCCRR